MTKKQKAQKKQTPKTAAPASAPPVTSTALRKYGLPAVLLLTALAYAGSLGGGFVTWDDNLYVTENPLIKDLSLSGIKAIFTTYYGGNYHPLVALSNAIEYRLFGLEPAVYRTVNLLLHLLNVLLVFRFIRLLSGRWEAALIAAAFFGLHPMHVESVAWISERKDLLYTAFFMGALISYMRFVQRSPIQHLPWMALGLFLLSLLSKSAAVVLPVVLLLMDYGLKRRFDMRPVLEKIPFFLLALIFGIIAMHSQHQAGTMNSLAPYSWSERTLIPLHNVFLYLWKAVLPLQLSAFYAFPSLGGPLPGSYYAAPFVLGLIAYLVFGAAAWRRDLAFGLLFFLVNLLLVIQVVSVGQTVASERYSYLSYLGLFFLVGQLYCRVLDSRAAHARSLRAALHYLLALYIIFFSVTTWQRSMVWNNSIALFSDMIENEPGAPVPYKNRGLARYHLADFQGAIMDFSNSIQLYPNDYEVFLDRGAAYFALNDAPRANEDFDAALKLKPDNADALVNSANAKAILGDLEGAMARFNRALALNPSHAAAYYNRGQLFLKMQQKEAACRDWHAAVAQGYGDAQAALKNHCP